MKPKTTIEDGKTIHYSAGAIIERDGKILLLERAIPPPGWACPAGHVDEGETFEEAMRREVLEETGLRITTSTLVLKARFDKEPCSKGVEVHVWEVFLCSATGEVTPNERETLQVKWCTKDDLLRLDLELAWKEWLSRLSYL